MHLLALVAAAALRRTNALSAPNLRPRTVSAPNLRPRTVQLDTDWHATTHERDDTAANAAARHRHCRAHSNSPHLDPRATA